MEKPRQVDKNIHERGTPKKGNLIMKYKYLILEKGIKRALIPGNEISS